MLHFLRNVLLRHTKPFLPSGLYFPYKKTPFWSIFSLRKSQDRSTTKSWKSNIAKSLSSCFCFPMLHFFLMLVFCFYRELRVLNSASSLNSSCLMSMKCDRRFWIYYVNEQNHRPWPAIVRDGWNIHNSRHPLKVSGGVGDLYSRELKLQASFVKYFRKSIYFYEAELM